MPELPEVETVVRTLESQIKDACICKVDVRYAKMIEMEPVVFANTLQGEHFRKFERRGKYLIFRMDHCTLVVHLRMEGKFFIQKPEDVCNKHIHVVFTLHDERELRYQDTRKFGRMTLVSKDYDFSHFHNLGPEPFSDACNAMYIYNTCKQKAVPLKTLLLDQSFIAGIGNIYADEILFACSLRPGRRCNRITHKDAVHLHDEMVRILKSAIADGGTTIRSYTSSLGVTGRFQLSCMVHTIKKCKVCGSEIHMKYIGSRSSYYCPECQK